MRKLICLEKHENEHENKIKNEKGKYKEVEKKYIALKASSSKFSTNEQSDCETRDDKNFDDEDMGLFVKRYNRCIWKNGVKYSDKNIINFRRLSNSSKEDENKKGKLRSSCYNCGKVSHYRPDCPMIKKDKEKGHHKKYSKSRRVYVAWESESDSSSDESSISSVESTKLCFMTNKKKKKKKKKNASHSKI
ncbi:uncharacterized protein LOC127114361 [Lathyrus oleraceus]|uniref:uncharacterized protein LOC127114361 n=1 Tax=Pisum sativum TaxID=3888 RepID=UPI0021CF964E|nr:uncharacterized protein LOC127114361 [Pisum sativum]